MVKKGEKKVSPAVPGTGGEIYPTLETSYPYLLVHKPLGGSLHFETLLRPYSRQKLHRASKGYSSASYRIYWGGEVILGV